MTTFVALFRGINVLGSNLLPMTDLKGVCEKNGCADVRTYIQSGNVIFRSASSNAVRLEKRLTAAVSNGHGFAPRVLVLPRRELERAVRGNPFPRAAKDPKTLHLYFLEAVPKNPDLRSLEALKTKGERFALKGRVFYLYTPEGFPKSKVRDRVERWLGVAATARNWRTVTTLLEMAKRVS